MTQVDVGHDWLRAAADDAMDVVILHQRLLSVCTKLPGTLRSASDLWIMCVHMNYHRTDTAHLIGAPCQDVECTPFTQNPFKKTVFKNPFKKTAFKNCDSLYCFLFILYCFVMCMKHIEMSYNVLRYTNNYYILISRWWSIYLYVLLLGCIS